MNAECGIMNAECGIMNDGIEDSTQLISQCNSGLCPHSEFRIQHSELK